MITTEENGPVGRKLWAAVPSPRNSLLLGKVEEPPRRIGSGTTLSSIAESHESGWSLRPTRTRQKRRSRRALVSVLYLIDSETCGQFSRTESTARWTVERRPRRMNGPLGNVHSQRMFRNRFSTQPRTAILEWISFHLPSAQQTLYCMATRGPFAAVGLDFG